jgi:hypothetical protein
VRYYWNDKEVSVEEYEALDLEWKKGVEAQELLEKNQEAQESSSKNSSRKKSGKQKIA